MRFWAREYRKSKHAWINVLQRIPLLFIFIAVVLSIFNFGFELTAGTKRVIGLYFIFNFILASVSIPLRDVFPRTRPRKKVWITDFALVALLITTVLAFFDIVDLPFFLFRGWIYILVLAVFVRELSVLNLNLKKLYINPAQLFVLSFVTIILIGAFLLMLPTATNGDIALIDAFFTSTSAVCVTGLAVVDTGTFFTLTGQTIILFLIQVGGLGIMTFTSYFSYFFRGGLTYENQVFLKDVSNVNKFADVVSTSKNIIFLTFGIEAVGAAFVFFQVDPIHFASFGDRLYFSVFHAISAFCNAGFSTLGNSLYQDIFRFNYPMHIIIAMLFIIGSLGFPILFNFFKYGRYLVLNRLFNFGRSKRSNYMPWVLNLNSRLILITTVVLIVVGTLFFYLSEYNNTLAEHSGFGKWVTAFFGAVTPRTAGFNTVDTSALHFSTILVVLLLMWIGASPGSTGGGIKTSTFAIATLNYLSLAKGKDRLEVFGRQVADISVKRAFAVISLSLMVIGASVFLISFFDGDKDLLDIAFECFSAYSTVGLSLGITASLSAPSKVVIIFTMLIGRVSMLTVLIALLNKVRQQNYRYPSDEILIN